MLADRQAARLTKWMDRKVGTINIKARDVNSNCNLAKIIEKKMLELVHI